MTETATDYMQQETKTCQNCKKDFVIEPDDFAFYQTINVPPPTWCPKCRTLRRLGWMGCKVLYKRTCDFTGDQVITFYHPSEPVKVYRQDIWWSDKWDPKEYGKKYDFEKPFFEQFKKLLHAVPLAALQSDYASTQESEYCNGAADLKNCYLCFRTDRGENCGYLNVTSKMKEVMDASFCTSCELSYDILNVDGCYRAFYSEHCIECQDVYFSSDLTGCSNCVGCINLRNKNYCIFNKEYSKEDYKKKFEELGLGSFENIEKLKQETQKFFLKFPKKAFRGMKNQNTSGDYIYNSKNVLDSYMVKEGENIRYGHFLKAPSANSYDYSIIGLNAEWIYECTWVGLNVNNIKSSFWTYNSHHLEYCYGCHGSENLFGCVGMKKGSYCILNMQYSKGEYEKLIEKIKKQMNEVLYIDLLGREYGYGEFFPSEICPWGFNETEAYGFFPLLKEEALKNGFRWRDLDLREYKNQTVQVPDNIDDVDDSIVEEILKCDRCGRNYRLIKMELDFYRRFKIPVPRKCAWCRDAIRTSRLNPIAIYLRRCMKCGKEIQTSYAPDRPEIVYCEKCYQAEVA